MIVTILSFNNGVIGRTLNYPASLNNNANVPALDFILLISLCQIILYKKNEKQNLLRLLAY